MNFELKHIKTFTVLIFMLLLAPVSKAEDCLRLFDLKQRLTEFNEDNIFPANSELHKLGGIRIIKTHASNGTNEAFTKIKEITEDNLQFSGALTLDVSMSPLECKSLWLKTLCDRLIVDGESIFLSEDLVYPIHFDRGFKIDYVNETYVISGNFKRVTMAGVNGYLYGACLKSCDPEINCRTEFYFEINNKEVTFKNNVFISANEGDQVKWELAGGIIEKESIVKHTFEPGVHEACMVVSRKRCIVPEERICKEFEIKEKCSVNFNHTIEGGKVSFENTSTLSLDESDLFEWNLGDETLSTEENPTHDYTAGIYKVCLEVNGAQCEADSATQHCEEITINSCLSGDQVLTPDNDNVSDFVFVKKGSLIYDRSGYLVYEAQSDVNWTGINNKNENLPLAVYTVVCAQGGKFNVTVIR